MFGDLLSHLIGALTACEVGLVAHEVDDLPLAYVSEIGPVAEKRPDQLSVLALDETAEEGVVPEVLFRLLIQKYLQR